MLLKTNPDQAWTVQTLVTKLGKYVSHQETLARQRETSERNKKVADGPKWENQAPTNVPNDSKMAGREKKKSPGNEDSPKKGFKCWFCDGDHPLHLCSVVKSITERK